MNSMIRSLDSIIIVDPQFGDYRSLFAEGALSEGRIKLFSSGEEALRAMGQPPPMLWMINSQLPDMTGTALLELIRRRLRRCNILLVGDSYSMEDELAARLGGATAYVCKPASAAWLYGYMPRCRSPAIRAGPMPFS